MICTVDSHEAWKFAGGFRPQLTSPLKIKRGDLSQTWVSVRCPVCNADLLVSTITVRLHLRRDSPQDSDLLKDLDSARCF